MICCCVKYDCGHSRIQSPPPRYIGHNLSPGCGLPEADSSGTRSVSVFWEKIDTCTQYIGHGYNIIYNFIVGINYFGTYNCNNTTVFRICNGIAMQGFSFFRRQSDHFSYACDVPT